MAEVRSITEIVRSARAVQKFSRGKATELPETHQGYREPDQQNKDQLH